ncbi:MAG: glycosyltransferase [bacterium]|nr:MAG: glycosyltransferase [bacterium]
MGEDLGKKTTRRDIPLPPPPGAPSAAGGERVSWPWTEADGLGPESCRDDGDYPRITVITPSYNQGEFIEGTIRSVLLQAYPNLEYMVVDGGSSDGTVDVIRKYESHLAWWVSESDKGQSHAINKGLARSTGEIVAYLNSDDMYCPGTLHSVGRYFSEHWDADLLYGDCMLIDDEDREMALWRSRDFDLYAELCRNFIYQPTVFMRERVIRKVGGFDENLDYVMDLDLWYRAAKHFRFHYIPERLACFRLTSDSKSGGSRVPFVREREEVLKRFLDSCGVDRVVGRWKQILSWHHFHAGEQLYNSGERKAAGAEFLKSMLMYPVSVRSIHALLGIFDRYAGGNLFKKLNVRKNPSPDPARKYF